MFKAFKSLMQVYRRLNYSLTKNGFYIMVFNEKICKIKAFEAYPTLETRGVFFDMFRAFDKV